MALFDAKAEKAKAVAKITCCKTIEALRDEQDTANTRLAELKSGGERTGQLNIVHTFLRMQTRDGR